MSGNADELTHLGADGEARMVDVTDKDETSRVAVAAGAIRMTTATLTAIEAGDAPKGDVLGTARLAGILAGKRTADLIPLCHALPGASVSVKFTLDHTLPGVRVSAEARYRGRTGVEMEALTAVSVALLTVYDMAKALDRSMVLEDIRLVRKEGGRSGVVSPPPAPAGDLPAE
jgi:cyclic pyranopterin phosphate synthase